MMTKIDLVILDELGYLPFSSSVGALLFHLLSKLYERTSVIITTNLSLSYDFCRLLRYLKPLPTTPFMVGNGGGWIVTRLVVMDRF